MKTDTSLRINKKILEEIRKLKEHKRDTYVDVIERLLDKEKKVNLR